MRAGEEKVERSTDRWKGPIEILGPYAADLAELRFVRGWCDNQWQLLCCRDIILRLTRELGLIHTDRMSYPEDIYAKPGSRLRTLERLVQHVSFMTNH